MLFPFLGYIVASTVLTAVAVLLTGLVNTVTLEKGRHHPPPVIARTVKVEVQRHSPVAKEASSAKDASPVAKEALPAKDASLVAKEASSAKDASPAAKEASSAKDASPAAKEASPAKDVCSFVATAKADTKKSKHYKPKVFAYKPKVLARQRDNYRYGNALGYAQEYGYGPRAPFFQ
jgi:hypothetical protein